MDNMQAKENIRVIREVMERSAHYTNFSGLSGVIAGVFALAGCGVSYLISQRVPQSGQLTWYAFTWALVFVASISQDFTLAQRKARRRGESAFNQAGLQVIHAVLPGIVVALVLSIKAVMLGRLGYVPAIWALGYGVADCAAGMFSVREVRVFGVAELLTGAVGLFFFSTLSTCLYLLGLTFGVYHIIFGVWLTRKYGW